MSQRQRAMAKLFRTVSGQRSGNSRDWLVTRLADNKSQIVTVHAMCLPAAAIAKAIALDEWADEVPGQSIIGLQ